MSPRRWRFFCLLPAFALGPGCQSEPLASTDGAGGDSGTGGSSALAGAAGEAGSADPECFAYDAPIAVGAVESSELFEISGMAASRREPGVLYVHNDSGDVARFFALDETGQTLGEYALSAVTAVDWEDMALGPGPGDQDFVFLGDIGDNAARTGGTPRSEVYVYRVPEPSVSLEQSPIRETITAFERLTLVYPEAPHDAETLMIDPLRAEIVIVTKENDGNSAVFTASALASAEVPVTLLELGRIQLGTPQTPGNVLATSGDISASGHAIVIRTYGSVLLWERVSDLELGAVFRAIPWPLRPPQELQGEAIAFAPDGRAWYTVAEGQASTIFAARANCDD